MSDQKRYPDNLPPEVTFRQLPARQAQNSRAVIYPEIDLPRYGEAEDFHLRGLWRIVRKRRWLIIGIVFIITTLVTIDVFRTKPLYEATTTIEIGRDNGMRVNSNGVFIQDEDYLIVTMNTSEVILKSLPLLEDVVVQLRTEAEGIGVEMVSAITRLMADAGVKCQQFAVIGVSAPNTVTCVAPARRTSTGCSGRRCMTLPAKSSATTIPRRPRCSRPQP